MLTLASIGRFHFLEQARALAARDRLDRFICDDPRVWSAAGWGRGCWLPRLAVAARMERRALSWFGGRLAEALRLAPLAKINSAFALETLRERKGEQVWVDHGSLDERWVAARMRQEAWQWGDPRAALGGNHNSAEILERQANEFALSAGVIVASNLARRSLTESGVSTAKIQVAALGVDSRRFRPLANGSGKRPFRLLHAGPVNFNKGVHRLIDAFRRADLPDAELWITGRAQDPDALEVFRRLAGDGKETRVMFRDATPQSQLPELFAKCDLFVLATLADGFGLTVLQALACGMPVIVTDGAGCAEVLDGCPAAEIIPAGDSGRLAEAIEFKYQRRRDAADWAGLRVAARRWAEALSWERHAARLLEVIG
jgi:glycosyltransferase involved in cell wall biosynthesis